MGSASNFHLQANTSIAGDFATATDLLKFTGSTNRISFGVPVDFSAGFAPGAVLDLAGAAPLLSLSETDQVDPAGRYRWAGAGGNFQLQKALTAAWATSEVLWEYDSTTSYLVLSKNLDLQHTAPQLRFTETDQVDPAGRYRLYANGQNFTLARSLGVNWASNEMIWQYDGALTTLVVAAVTKFTNAPVILENANPQLRLYESDQTAPAGQYRFISSGDLFFCQRALTANFDTSTTIWQYDGSLGTPLFTIANMAQIGSVSINRTSGAFGAMTAGRIGRADAGDLDLMPGDAATFVQFRNFAGTLNGRFDAPGVTAPAQTYSVVTKEKGDVRYTAISSQRYKQESSADAAALLVAFDQLALKGWIWGGEPPEGDERLGSPASGSSPRKWTRSSPRP